MTVREVIRRADLLRPNTLAGEDKARWLRATEAEYAETMGVPLPANVWPEDQTLLMPEPHDTSYIYALCASIDLANAETELYANDHVIANAMLAEAKAWWRREHRPRPSGNWRAM